MARFLVELPNSDNEGRMIDSTSVAVVLRGTGSLLVADNQILITELPSSASATLLLNPSRSFDSYLRRAPTPAKRPEADDYMAMAKASS